MKSLFDADDRFGLASLILPAVQNNDPIGLIAKMSLYRNVFFHFIGPTAGPFGASYCFREHLGPTGPIPYVQFPLYDNIEELIKIEKGKTLSSLKNEHEEAVRFAQLTSHTDALDLCFESLSLLLLISQALESKIALSSEPQVIDAADILELTVTESDGSTKRYRKNETGKLQEYD